MANYLRVEGGFAVNAARADASWAAAAPGEWIEATGDAGIGWSWDGAAWSAPVEPVLTDAERAATIILSPVRFWAALDAALGLTTSDPLVDEYVANAITASPLSDTDKRLALTLMRTAREFHRADPDNPTLMDAVGAILGLSSAQIDTLFLNAAGG